MISCQNIDGLGTSCPHLEPDGSKNCKLLNFSNKPKPKAQIAQLLRCPCDLTTVIKKIFDHWARLFAINPTYIKKKKIVIPDILARILTSRSDICSLSELKIKIHDELKKEIWREYLEWGTPITDEKLFRYTLTAHLKQLPSLAEYETQILDIIKKMATDLSHLDKSDAWHWAWCLVYESCHRYQQYIDGLLGCADCRTRKIYSSNNMLYYTCDNSASDNCNKNVPPYYYPKFFGDSNFDHKMKELYPVEYALFQGLQKCELFELSKESRWEPVFEGESDNYIYDNHLSSSHAVFLQGMEDNTKIDALSLVSSPSRISAMPAEIRQDVLKEAEEFIRLSTEQGWLSHDKDLESKIMEIYFDYCSIGDTPSITDLKRGLQVSDASATAKISNAVRRIGWLLVHKENLLRLRAVILYTIADSLSVYPTFAYDWQSQEWPKPGDWKLEQGLFLDDLVNQCLKKIIEREKSIDPKRDLLLLNNPERFGPNSRKVLTEILDKILEPIEELCATQHEQLPAHSESSVPSSVFPDLWKSLLKCIKKDPILFMRVYSNFVNFKLKLREKRQNFRVKTSPPKLTPGEIFDAIYTWGTSGEAALNGADPPDKPQSTSEQLISELALNRNQKDYLLLFNGLLVEMWLDVWPRLNEWFGAKKLPSWARKLLGLFDIHDFYTRYHSEQTAFLLKQFTDNLRNSGVLDAQNISDYLQSHGLITPEYLSDKYAYMLFEFPDIISFVGLFHDIGKLFVNRAILHKPGKLNEDERWFINRHVVDGVYLLKFYLRSKRGSLCDHFGSEQLSWVSQLFLDSVRYHHETWNGEGYAKRLIGDQIPPIARLIGYADSHEAMASPRPYRHKCLSWCEIEEELRKKMVKSGSQCIYKDKDDPVLLCYIKHCHK
jgi:HD-GYP domain-containing protein (c-di-GMP phosphodiesterase class II)